MARFRVYMVVSAPNDEEVLQALGAAEDALVEKFGDRRAAVHFAAVKPGYADQFRAFGADPSSWYGGSYSRSSSRDRSGRRRSRR